ncbi:MAG: hypothetical protein L0Y72_12250 [Gemmataceae bacterium]|nr:hypothetical protein [Gemmataceae bacterium]MCI0739809.1 hypothetical protein [Gemmataceae bacterium]
MNLFSRLIGVLAIFGICERPHESHAQEKGGASSRAELTAAEYAKRFWLRYDRKLQKKLNIVAKHPPIGQVLEELRTATGLQIVLADNLSDHDPDLGDMHMPGAPAFSFMELLEKAQLETGRWVKTADGYRLEGVSKARRTSTSARYGWTIGTATGLAVVGAGLFFWHRRRTNSAPKPQGTA